LSNVGGGEEVKAMRAIRCEKCSCILRKLDQAELSKFSGMIRPLTYRKGAIIYEQDTPAYSFYIICQGKVELARNTLIGKRQIINILGPRDLLGVEVLSDEAYYITYARVKEEACLIMIDKREFFLLLSKYPSLVPEAIARLAEVSVDLERRLAMILFKNVRARLAALFLDLSRRYGAGGKESIILDLRLTNEDIAELIGSTPQTVSISLNKLKKKELIGRNNCDVKILKQLDLQDITEDSLFLDLIPAGGGIKGEGSRRKP